MNRRTQSVVALSIFVLILAGVVVNQIAQHTFDSLSIPYLAMALVGAVIVSRTGGNPVGWVMLGIGLIAVSSALAGILADQSDVPKWSLVLGSLFSDSMFFATLAGTFVFLPLLFPNGRPPTPRWGLGCVGGRGRRSGERGARSDPAHRGRRGPQPARGRRSPGSRGLGQSGRP